MGKRGPVPKKTFLKVLSGNLSLQKKLMEDGQTQQFNPPPVPKNLSAEEKNIWDQTVELLKPLKHLENIDGAILAAYCCSYVRWAAAEKEIQKSSKKSAIFGLLATGANGGAVINPLVNISRRAQADMVTYAAQLGMTPAARLRIQMVKDEPKENPFQKLKNDNKKQVVANSQKLCPGRDD